jgi:predicted HAD superfamily Cof-like phosphohydrolase
MSDLNPQQFAEQFVSAFIEKLPPDSSLANANVHQLAVSAFCDICAEHAPQQHVNYEVTNRATREQVQLRAALQLEEIFEMIRGMGVSVRLKAEVPHDADIAKLETSKHFDIVADGSVNLKEIIDGLADDSVISNGTASLFGIPLAAFTSPVDINNLNKFRPGHSFREDGKLIKPEGHPAPNLEEVLSQVTGGKTFADFPIYNWSDVEED